MQRRTAVPFRPGFTITELLISLSLLILFFAAAGQVFRSTVLLSAAGSQLSDLTAQTDSALFQLRQDVWNSRSINANDPHAVDLVLANGSPISWKIDSENSLTRTVVGSPPEHWNFSAAHWSFSAGRSTLILSDGTPARISMVSQILLASRSQP
jgi:hypothetical protein